MSLPSTSSVKRLRCPLLLLAAALAAAPFGVRAEDAPATAAAPLGKAADNKIYAQSLVNGLMAKHPELVVVGLHVVAPGAKEEKMIASNLDRIGKKDDDDDIAVATERKTICAPNMTDPHKFEVQVPMKDSSGAVIGAIGFVFKYNAGDDEVKLHAKAVAMRDALAKRIASLADLFKTAEL
jgi:hypothetical protein